MQMETDALNTQWESASQLRMASQGSQGTRLDLETRELRTILTRRLKETVMTKPACT